MSDTRTKEQIKADIAAARARISANVENLIEEVHPKSIAQRTVSDAKAFATAEFQQARSHVQTDDGKVRWDTVVIVGGAIAGLILFSRALKGLGAKKKR